MKNAAILAASFAIARLVGAIPVNKRDVVYTTSTEEVWETFWSTTTIWVDPAVAVAAPSSSSPGGFYQVQSSAATSFASVVKPTYSSAPAPSIPASSAPAPSIPASSAPAPSIPAPSAPASIASVAQLAPISSTPAPSHTSTSVYVAPVVPTTSTTPVSTYVAPTPTPAPTTSTSVYVAPVVASSIAPAAAPSVAAVPSTTTGDHTGDMTYYDVSVGLGSCGVSGSNSQDLVAINAIDMANGINPNQNPHCGKTINISYNGNTHTATVFDTCPECAEGAIDLTNELFLKIAPDGNGRVHGVSWSWA